MRDVKEERVLIFDPNGQTRSETSEVIRRELPSLHVTTAETFPEAQTLSLEYDFSVVVLNYDFAPSVIDLLHRLKLSDCRPEVLLLCGGFDPALVSELYDSGVGKVVVREGEWLQKISPSLRRLLRMHRLEQENELLLAKLTQANLLLEERNKRLDEFCATLAHDIRGPLAGISMKLEYLGDTYSAANDERFRGLMGRALQSTDRLNGMVSAMYEFARLGSRATRMRHIEMGSLVDEIVSDMQFDEEREVQIGIGDLPQIWGSPELLRRVFINLVSNAVKYNDKEEVIINIGAGDLEKTSLGTFAEIFVQDNGRGIDERDLGDIFSMFKRANQGSPSQDGLGVGLAVVQRIAELHYGKVLVNSELGTGTTFRMFLPTSEISIRA